METYFLMLKISLLSAAVGFGLRLGWEFLPIAEKALAYVMAAPYWLYLVWKRR